MKSPASRWLLALLIAIGCLLTVAGVATASPTQPQDVITGSAKLDCAKRLPGSFQVAIPFARTPADINSARRRDPGFGYITAPGELVIVGPVVAGTAQGCFLPDDPGGHNTPPSHPDNDTFWLIIGAGMLVAACLTAFGLIALRKRTQHGRHGSTD